MKLGAPSIERFFARWVGDHKGQPSAIDRAFPTSIFVSNLFSAEGGKLEGRSVALTFVMGLFSLS